ncbi:hypothetical protein XENTR_v10008434 [Xenopus tropicalis]|nr:hypothetical protein XENTR_v10008434 [Xenopus tropicalis]
MEKAEGRNVEEGHSKELLNIGGGGGFYNQLLINPKYSNKQGSNSPITRMPRSSILDRVQNFLPQLAKANESLSKEIESSPVGTFDIEHVDEKEEKIIEMVVQLAKQP